MIVDRNPALYADLAVALDQSDPDDDGPLRPNFRVDTIEDVEREVTPQSAKWVINTSGLSNSVKYLLIVRYNGVVTGFVKGTLNASQQTLTVSRSFGDTDIGRWQVEAILQDTVTGAQYSNVGPSVGVTKNDF